MKIAVVIDTWLPEINGVVTTMHKIVEELKGLGHEPHVLSHADGFRTIPMPGYSSIRLALFPQRKVKQWLDRVQPDAIHISTEGPLGAAARRYCMKRGLHFTTCYHTKFPEYISARVPIPLSVGYAWIRGFHAPASRLMVSTPSLMQELKDSRTWCTGARASIPSSSSPGTRASSGTPGRCSCTWDAWPSRRTSRPS